MFNPAQNKSVRLNRFNLYCSTDFKINEYFPFYGEKHPYCVDVSVGEIADITFFNCVAVRPFIKLNNMFNPAQNKSALIRLFSQYYPSTLVDERPLAFSPCMGKTFLPLLDEGGFVKPIIFL